MLFSGSLLHSWSQLATSNTCYLRQLTPEPLPHPSSYLSRTRPPHPPPGPSLYPGLAPLPVPRFVLLHRTPPEFPTLNPTHQLTQAPQSPVQ